jgi:phosphatidylinositol alpha-mannosyltransferase
MKILLTHPFCRPYIRRGAETILAQLTDYLVSRGHDVTVFSSKPGAPEILHNGCTTFLASQDSALTRYLHLSPRYYFFLTALKFMRAHPEFELVHAMHHIDACAARIAQQTTGIPYVYSMFGIPSAWHYHRRPIEHLGLRHAIQGAEEVMVLSQAAQNLLQSDYKKTGTCIPGFIDPGEFPMVKGRDLDRPLILSVAAFSERRKGLLVLMRAFQIVKGVVPNARLCVVGSVSPQKRRQMLDLLSAEIRDSIEFFGIAQTEQLPALYQKAAVTVLPSIWEALGTVLLESLASGTPVVGTRHAGIPDVIGNGVGFLFDPGEERSQATNAPGLAECILNAFELHRDPLVAERCRRHVMAYTWSSRGPDVEAMYERAIAARSQAGASVSNSA